MRVRCFNEMEISVIILPDVFQGRCGLFKSVGVIGVCAVARLAASSKIVEGATLTHHL